MAELNDHLSLVGGRGNHETGGSWSIGGMAEDVEDVKAVVAYLASKRGYRVVLVIGHSRGSIVGMRWAADTVEGHGLLGFVNVSARKRMAVSLASYV